LRQLLFSSTPTPQLGLQLSRRHRKTSVIYFFVCSLQLGLDEATVSLLRLSFKFNFTAPAHNERCYPNYCGEQDEESIDDRTMLYK
jgi:hypothetical protein